MGILFWISIVIFCIDCTLARPERKIPPGKVPPGQENGQKKLGETAVDRLLRELKYESRPKTLSEWRQAFADAANKNENYGELQMKVVYRQAIEEVEDEFPQPYDDDFETKKVTWDRKILATKAGHDEKEERRRQKWLHYTKNPPNDLMKRIVKRAKDVGVDEETLAKGIAKAYRLLSGTLHKDEVKPAVIRDPKKFYVKASVVNSLKIILKEVDILDEYIPEDIEF